jgi:hypothetical protein
MKGAVPMGESVTGTIVQADHTGLTVHVPYTNWERFCLRKYADVEVLLTDGRQITVKQRNAIHAMVHDITEFTSGYAWKNTVFNKTLAELELQFVIDLTDSEQVRYTLTHNYCRLTETPLFSLASKADNCADETTAREFLSWLIDLCVEHAIPTSGKLIDRAEDIGRYLYACIKYKRCAICGLKADLHHVDRVGMGRSRREITHLGMRAESLCRGHHGEVDNIGQQVFDERYHIFGIAMDETLCKIHKLKYREEPA